MRRLSTSELLDLWERALGETPARRPLWLVAAACDSPIDEIADLAIGELDARLMDLREWTFGPDVASVASCPRCGDQLELNLQLADLRVPSAGDPRESLAIEAAGCRLSFRLPNSADLEAAARCADLADSRRLLFERCLLAAARGSEAVPAGELPEEAVTAVEQQMEAADPQADVQLAISCVRCSHRWQQTFDIGSFFWSEIHVWSQRILREVHTLASAYGWSESEILALGPGRREFYLEMVSG